LQKLASTKRRLSDLTIQHETSTTEASFLRSKVEDLALRHAKLEEASRTAQIDAQRLRDEADEVMRALRKEEDEREVVEADLASARADAQRARERAEDRERDVADLQRALDGLERSTRHAGDAANHDRSALGVELERAKRDLARARHELADAEAEIDARTNLVKEKDLRIAELVRPLLVFPSRSLARARLTRCLPPVAGVGQEGPVDATRLADAGPPRSRRQTRPCDQGASRSSPCSLPRLS